MLRYEHAMLGIAEALGVAVAVENRPVTARARLVNAAARLLNIGNRPVSERKLDAAPRALHAAVINLAVTAGRPRVGVRRLFVNAARHNSKPSGFSAAALSRAVALLGRLGNVMFFKNKAARHLAIARSPAVNPLQLSHKS